MKSDPRPRSALLIILGAHEWPEDPELGGSTAFLQSALAVKDYFVSREQFALPKRDILDLFNTPRDPNGIDKAIVKFLARRAHALRDQRGSEPVVILYYTGHGAFGDGFSGFYLAVRCTRLDNPGASGLSMASLAATLLKHAANSPRILILDCCFAAAAFSYFQTQTDDLVRSILEPFPAKGTAMLCSSSAKALSRIEPEEKSTMFTGALLDALRAGDPGLPERMSLRDVGSLVRDYLIAKYRDRAARPEVHSPDMREGDVSEMPLFPNHAARLRVPAIGPAEPPPLPTGAAEQEAAAAPTRRETSSSPNRMLDDVFDADPTVALPAAQALVNSPGIDLAGFVSRLRVSGDVPTLACRLIVKSFPEETAPLMVRRLLHAKDNWDAAVGTGSCFVREQHPLCYGDILKLVQDFRNSDPETVRGAVKALGELGAYTCARELYDLVSPDDFGQVGGYWFDKLWHYVLPALARCFVADDDPYEEFPSPFFLEKGLLQVHALGGSYEATLHVVERDIVRILSNGSGKHADVIMGSWLRSGKTALRNLAVRILGQKRLARATQPLIELLGQHQEANDEVQIYLALGNIQSESGVEWLIRDFESQPHGRNAAALGFALEAVRDKERLSNLAAHLLDVGEFGVLEKGLVFRAIGLRKLHPFADTIKRGLHEPEPANRGHAALSLARLGMLKHKELLRRAFGEASNSLEKVLTSLAMLEIRDLDYAEVALSRLRAELLHGSWKYNRPARDDVLSSLTHYPHHTAKLIAECYKPLYDEALDY